MATSSTATTETLSNLKPEVEQVENASTKSGIPVNGDDVPAIQHGAKSEPQAPHERHLPMGVVETKEEQEKKWYIGSIDQGTTSSRFLIFDAEGTPVASHQIEFENLYPHSG